jgi:plasmid stability protein
LQRVQLVPEDLLDAIGERAAKDGQSPDAVVREALSNYLDTA